MSFPPSMLGSSAEVLFSCPFVFNSLHPHGLQHARAFYPSPSSKVCPSSCSLCWWCRPPISSSDTLFCSHSFLASGTFPMSHLFASDDQNTGVSASASVFPTSIQDWFPLRLTGLISLLSKGLWGVFCSTIIQRHQFFAPLSTFFMVQLSQSHIPLGRP